LDVAGTSLKLITPPSALQAWGGQVAHALAVVSVTEAELEPLVAAAIKRWAGVLTGDGILAALANVQFVITDLPGSTLAMSSENAIYVDPFAAGHGWFVDPTPASDEEFLQVLGSRELPAVGSEAVGCMDLLTVLSHELGHVAGLKDLAADQDDVMSGVLGVGVRRTPWAAGADELFGALGATGMDRPAGYVNESALRQPEPAAASSVKPVANGLTGPLVETCLAVRDGRTVASKRRVVKDDLFDLFGQKGFEFDLLAGRP